MKKKLFGLMVLLAGLIPAFIITGCEEEPSPLEVKINSFSYEDGGNAKPHESTIKISGGMAQPIIPIYAHVTMRNSNARGGVISLAWYHHNLEVGTKSFLDIQQGDPNSLASGDVIKVICTYAGYTAEASVTIQIVPQ
jgi:hypothetical protein